MKLLARFAKALLWGATFLIALVYLSEKAIAGHTNLMEGVFVILIVGGALALTLAVASNAIRRQQGEPVSTDPLSKRFSDWLLDREPLVLNGYRIAIILLLALGIDKVDKLTWSIANEQLASLSRIERQLKDIRGHTSNIDDNTSGLR